MTKKFPLSYVELSRKNLEHNLKSLRSITKAGTKLAFAIKGNAYGHGQNEIAKIAERFCDYFVVNSFEELRLLRAVSKKPTFVLGYVMQEYIADAIKLGCILSVFSKEQFTQIEKISKQMKKVQEVHVAVDALLGREGFLASELSHFLCEAVKSKSVRITGIYAHFANIEDTNNFTHAERQIAAYNEMLDVAKKAGCVNMQTHISATSGILAYEKGSGIHAVVRTGIGAYGLWPSEHLQYAYKKNLQLLPVLSWKTHVAQVKILPSNRTVGYGLTFTTRKKTVTALIPQGYADGYPRILSNKGFVLIGGKKCPIIGRISMNMFVVDVSKAGRVQEGDEVVLLGSQGKTRIVAEELGELSGTINYEVTTRISSLLPRVVV